MSNAVHQIFHSMGIPVHLTFVGISEKQASPVATAARQAIERSAQVQQVFDVWDTRCSRFKEQSELHQLNMRSGEWVTVGPELFNVIQKCFVLAEETDGVFDPSVGSYLAAHGYGLPERYTLPHVVPTYHDIELDEKHSKIRCAPGQILEPAAIVKGIAIDAAAQELSDVSGWMINAGGDILTHGSFGIQEQWHVGIQHPTEKNALVAAVAVRDEAVATSGTYEAQWLFRGEQWHHQVTMDRGVPTTGVLSLTVIAATAEKADTLASIAFLYGLERGRAYLDVQHVRYLFVDTELQLHENNLFKERAVDPESIGATKSI